MHGEDEIIVAAETGEEFRRFAGTDLNLNVGMFAPEFREDPRQHPGGIVLDAAQADAGDPLLGIDLADTLVNQAQDAARIADEDLALRIQLNACSVAVEDGHSEDFLKPLNLHGNCRLTAVEYAGGARET